jgi:hypothetical protein
MVDVKLPLGHKAARLVKVEDRVTFWKKKENLQFLAMDSLVKDEDYYQDAATIYRMLNVVLKPL